MPAVVQFPNVVKEAWHFTKSIRIGDVGHRVRVVILSAKRKDKTTKKILVTNRTY